ncbi:MAG TPA: zf-HC2 domain-containing protein [Gemmatimonadaceae bacterium]|nr:zf-HC2 domain-containing protein [Gemmatimonadaceae bacterium]
MDWHPDETQLNDFADGELEESSRAAVQEHVSRCPQCASVVTALNELLADASALPGSMEPPPGLWESVRRRTVAPRRSRAWMYWELRAPLAAAAALLVMAASAITWWIAPADRAVQTAVESAPAPAAFGLASAEADYLEATRTLLLVLQERRSRMDPAVVAAVEQNLRVIAIAVENAKAALAADPANQDVAAILNATYQAQVRMLRSATHEWGET